MKLRLTFRIVLIFVIVVAALLVAVGMLSYRSGSETLQAATISRMQAVAIEKEAAVVAWMDQCLGDLEQVASELDLTERASLLLAAAPQSDEASSLHATVLRELDPHLSGSPFLLRRVIYHRTERRKDRGSRPVRPKKGSPRSATTTSSRARMGFIFRRPITHPLSKPRR